jgi:hypothetical protein
MGGFMNYMLVGVALVALGIVYRRNPALFRRGPWLRTSIAIRMLSADGYLRYMRGLGLVLIVLGAGFSLFGLATLPGPGEGEVAAKQRRWNAELAARLPRGSSRAQVDAYFTALGVEHGYDATANTIVAIDRNVQGSWIVSTDIRIFCPLDAAGKLQSCATALVHTGP